MMMMNAKEELSFSNRIGREEIYPYVNPLIKKKTIDNNILPIHYLIDNLRSNISNVYPDGIRSLPNSMMNGTYIACLLRICIYNTRTHKLKFLGLVVI